MSGGCVSAAGILPELPLSIFCLPEAPEPSFPLSPCWIPPVLSRSLQVRKGVSLHGSQGTRGIQTAGGGQQEQSQLCRGRRYLDPLCPGQRAWIRGVPGLAEKQSPMGGGMGSRRSHSPSDTPDHVGEAPRDGRILLKPQLHQRQQVDESLAIISRGGHRPETTG